MIWYFCKSITFCNNKEYTFTLLLLHDTLVTHYTRYMWSVSLFFTFFTPLQLLFLNANRFYFYFLCSRTDWKLPRELIHIYFDTHCTFISNRPLCPILYSPVVLESHLTWRSRKAEQNHHGYPFAKYICLQCYAALTCKFNPNHFDSFVFDHFVFIYCLSERNKYQSSNINS